MRICIVSTHYPSDDAIGEYCGNMAAELCKKAEVFVLANKRVGSPTTERIRPNPSCNYLVYRIWNDGLLFPFTILRQIIKLKPNLVHVQHEFFLYGKKQNVVVFPLLLLLIKLTRVPLVLTMHHVIPVKEIPYFRALLRTAFPGLAIKLFLLFFNRIAALTANVIVVPSPNFRNVLSSNYNVKIERIEIVKHFTDMTSAKEPISQEKTMVKMPSLFGVENVLLFFGYIRPSKGIEHMLYALPRVLESKPNTVFCIVGKAQDNYIQYLSFLKQLVVNLKLTEHVKFQDHVPDENLPTIFSASDAVVFPYVSTIGSTPIAHLKAAAFGKPIIASNIDIFRQELEDHKNALLVPPGDSECLSKSVIELFSDDELKRNLSKNIRLYCEERSQKKAAIDTLRIYSKLLHAEQTAQDAVNRGL